MIGHTSMIPKSLSDRIQKIPFGGLVDLAKRLRGGRFPMRILNYLAHQQRQDKRYFVSSTNRGIKFVGDWQDNYAIHCLANSAFDEHIVSLIAKHLEGKVGVYLDIGTNLGIVAASIASLIKGRVVAFEPVPETFERAAGTIALNSLSNVTLFNKAVGATTGSLKFYKPINHSEGASAVRNDYVAECGATEIEVEVIRCDDLEPLIGDAPIIFIKIDVEGFEPEVIKGARALIAKHRPQILFEYHPKVAPSSNWTALDVVQLISRDINYSFEVLYEDGSVGLFPPRDGAIANILATAVP